MKKRIKTIKQLPDWFDLSKYGDAKKLDTAGWYEQLKIRQQLRLSLPTKYEFAVIPFTLQSKAWDLIAEYFEIQKLECPPGKHKAIYTIINHGLMYLNNNYECVFFSLDDSEIQKLEKELNISAVRKNQPDKMVFKELSGEDLKFIEFLMGKPPFFNHEIFNLIRDTPIIDIQQCAFLKEQFNRNELAYIKLKKINSIFGIRSMNMFDFLKIEKELSPKHRKKIKNKNRLVDLWLGNSEDTLSLRGLIPSHLDLSWLEDSVQPISSLNPMKAISIDLRLPDKLLIESFKEYLIEARNTTKVDYYDKKFTKCRFNNWIKQGVLPYLDLKIWEQQTGNSITNNVMSRVIFSEEEGEEKGEDNIRRTVQDTVDKLMSEKLLIALAGEAAFEIASKNKK